MIILNRCKKTSEIIRCVLQKISMSPIVYTERLRGVSKNCETVLHSIQRAIKCVGHSGCREEKALFYKGYSLKMGTISEHKSLRCFFSQSVRSLMKSAEKLKLRSLGYWFCKHGICSHKCTLDREFPLPMTHIICGKPL